MQTFFLIFLIFCWAALVLVIAIFALFIAGTFARNPAVASASLLFIVIAPVFGYLLYRCNMSITIASLIFVPLIFMFIWLATLMPLDLVTLFRSDVQLERNIWITVLFVYVAIASIMPVWLLLQPFFHIDYFMLPVWILSC